ncbi:hypothetical protein HZB60_03015 [candidate division KSB1 bacterium]|nr:hypothetical protein [candidate division KSB1 bacterium]
MHPWFNCSCVGHAVRNSPTLRMLRRPTILIVCIALTLSASAQVRFADFPNAVGERLAPLSRKAAKDPAMVADRYEMLLTKALVSESLPFSRTGNRFEVWPQDSRDRYLLEPLPTGQTRITIGNRAEKCPRQLRPSAADSALSKVRPVDERIQQDSLFVDPRSRLVTGDYHFDSAAGSTQLLTLMRRAATSRRLGVQTLPELAKDPAKCQQR